MMMHLSMLYALLLWFCTEEYPLFLTFSVVQASADQNGCRPIRTRPVCLLHQWVPAKPQRALFFYTLEKGIKRTAFSPGFSFLSIPLKPQPCPRESAPLEKGGSSFIHSLGGGQGQRHQVPVLVGAPQRRGRADHFPTGPPNL